MRRHGIAPQRIDGGSGHQEYQRDRMLVSEAALDYSLE
jgi:hypothetical protein